ncbi:short-chain alcohol dehydrogenase [Paramarasmius palmivorus]|uniref:Short-chain alcohol dehydrogenase n=1 Tax=Paramarasmius palmivorus TaxID=297713 RepID=A0AAW0CV12_9AGAR
MGNAVSSSQLSLSQWFPPKPKFWQKDIPDLSGKVIIVTGPKAGIGKETVKALLQHNAKVYFAARGKQQSEGVIDELQKVTGKRAIFLELDLASFASIKKAAAEFLSKETELHVLFNNAGLMWPPLDTLTKEGYDAQWGVHVVGHHLFTKLLLPALEAGARSSADGKARIVSTSSSAAYLEQVIHWDTFIPGSARNKIGNIGLYNQSKFAQVVWTRELAKRYGDRDILAFSCNPGNLKTDLSRNLSFTMRVLTRMLLYPVDPYGSLTQLYAGTSPEVVHKANGSFFVPWAREGPTPLKAIDNELGEKLWKYLEDEVKKAPA